MQNSQRMGSHLEETLLTSNDLNLKRARVPVLPQLPQQQSPTTQQYQQNYAQIKQEPGTSNSYYMNYGNYGGGTNFNFPVPVVPQTISNQGDNNAPKDNNNFMDFGNISLPNLSDVNLSLLESHLSENFNDNLNISDNNF